MQVAKWGNSLAVRIPAAIVARLELREGDEVAITASTGRFVIAKAERDAERDRAMTTIRGLARPLPAGWKIEREAANSHLGDDSLDAGSRDRA